MCPLIKSLNLRILDLESPWKVLEFEVNQCVGTLFIIVTDLEKCSITSLAHQQINEGFVYYKHATFLLHEIDWWIGDICVMIWSTLILTAPIHSKRIHWWASDLMLNFSQSFLMKKQTHMRGWVHFQQIFIFGETKSHSFVLSQLSILEKWIVFWH